MATPVPSLDPIRPIHWGALRVTPEMHVRDLQNRFIRDITPMMLEARVKIVWKDDIKYTLTGTMEGDDVPVALQECLAPIITVEWRDRAGQLRRVREQLGLFLWLPPVTVDERGRRVTRIDGMDVLWALGQLTTRKLLTLTPGRLVGDEAKTLLYGQSEIVTVLPKTNVKTGKTRKIKPATNLLAAANELYNAAGYTDIRPTRHGRVTAYPLRDQHSNIWERIIESAHGDVFDSVEIDPDPERFCNQVYLKSNDPNADSASRAGYRISNTSRASPWSIPNLGFTVAKSLADDRSETFAVLKKRAYTYLQRAASLNTRIRLSVVPDPRFNPQEIWLLRVRRDDGTRIGDWEWVVEELEFFLGGRSNGTQNVVLGKRLRMQDVT